MTSDGHPPSRSRYDTLRALVASRAGSRAADPDVVPALEALCCSVVTRLPVQGAVVSLVSTTVTAGVAAASDAGARARAEIAFITGEGPGVDAVASHRPVLVPDLASGTARWPGYTSTAIDAGLAAVFAFPLHVGGVVLGVLEMYADRAGSLSESQLADALTYAQIATDVLLDGRLLLADGALQAGLASALDYRAEIHQAQGMLMVSLGITLTEALVRMRSYAFSTGRPLIEVARDIHDGHQLGSETD